MQLAFGPGSRFPTPADAQGFAGPPPLRAPPVPSPFSPISGKYLLYQNERVTIDVNFSLPHTSRIGIDCCATGVIPGVPRSSYIQVEICSRSCTRIPADNYVEEDASPAFCLLL